MLEIRNETLRIDCPNFFIRDYYWGLISPKIVMETASVENEWPKPILLESVRLRII